MKKIFTETDTFDPVLHSESYMVYFLFQDTEGIWIRDSIRYFTSTKNAHRFIESIWKKHHKKAKLISIKYE